MALLLVSTLASGCESFVQQPQQQFIASSTQLKTAPAPALPDLSEVLNGESCVEPSTKEFLEATEATEAPLAVNGDNDSKRVPVSVRYSEKSGLRPYYLTVAKKIKETFPDVVMDKILLPKVEVSENANINEGSTFEVIVDGKIVVRSPSRKGSSFGESVQIFVNMQEVEAAICRARKRRRPQTVYGEDDSNARLEVLRNKAKEQGPGSE
eukprot:CAMPEP_0113607966 /NCGR_PEP_ID=MMETSP0017_2-20120614/3669_1 /TAXON_ID=2856 /ORGANISM="Cylindrotheca closterium" /LENGTH=209 /DNA_ID=CAMNT_0000516611 /DNA_START=71 /DNA_END=700 /DNA_ORIENTATION=- /assembly_acc=CAM_ASM_000147